MNKIHRLIELASVRFSLISKTPRLDAELLLCHVLKKERAYLFAYPEKELSSEEQKQWFFLVEQRCLRVPVAYLTGRKSFWNLELQVNEHTLIPRSETELLVEIILEKFSSDNAIELLDLGTGSGAIALALAKEKPDWKIFAVDSSPEALKTAKVNAEKNHIQNVEFFQSDWFSAFPSHQRWHIIVSNPPYLDENDPHLSTEEICHEPRTALVAKRNGLEDIEEIIRSSRHHLTSGGWVFLEHGFEQGAAVRQLFLHSGYDSVNTLKDIAGLERVTYGRVLISDAQ